MKRVIIAPAEFGGAALGELKAWLAISTSHDDILLTRLLTASAEACEAATGTMPLSATCEEVHPILPDWQTLSSQPIQAITGIEGIPAEGARFALPSDAYEFDMEADGSGRFRVARRGAAGRVAVRFVCGLAQGWGSLPDGLRQGIIRHAGEQYRDRDGGGSNQPSAAIGALWRPWRRPRLT